MALSAAIAALPTVIEKVSKVIDDLSKLKKPKPGDLKDQNTKLGEALKTLKDSVGKIGISIRDYVEIYTVTLKEEAAAKALTKQFSQADFDALKTLDSDLKKSVSSHKKEIEKDDLDKINDIRSDIQGSFNKAEKHLIATPKNLTEVCNDINDICTKLGDIYSLLNGRFEGMSNNLIGIESLKSK